MRKYSVEITECTHAWRDSMRLYMSRVLGSDVLGAQTLSLLATTWAPSTSATYGSFAQRYFELCKYHQLSPLACSPATIAICVTWFGNHGTIKASSLQPYLSAVNSFCKDRGREPVIMGNPAAPVCNKELEASHVMLSPTPIHVPLPFLVVLM
jgi:hypothetical protein